MAGFLPNGFIRSAVLAMTVVALALLFMPEVESRSVRGKKTVGAAVAKESGCRLFYYFDGGTDLCEYCGDLCDHADIWGTEEQCQTECPDYLRSRRCQSDEYYDDQTRTCSPCRDICLHHLIRGTTGQCHTYCPDYQPATQTPLPTSRSPALGDGEEEKDPRQTHNPPASALTDHLVWIVPCVSVVVFLAGVGAIFLLFKRRQPNPVTVKYQPAPSVTEDSLTGCPPVTVPLTHPETETQPGIRSELVCA